MGIVFEWSAEKARANRRKHGVSFDDAASVLDDSLSLTVPDTAHSGDEDRFVTLGHSMGGKMLVVVHTDRGERLRILSARQAIPREVRQYEQRGQS